MRNERRKEEQKKSFKSIKSIDEMLKTFKEMESLFQESELGIEAWTLAHKLHNESNPRDPEKILHFGKKALKILIDKDNNNVPLFNHSNFEHNHGSSLFIPCVLNLLGSACHDLKRYDEGLSYLHWADRNLTRLEKDETVCRGNCILLALLDTHKMLLEIKMDVGKGEMEKVRETLVNAKKVLEIQEKIAEEEDCIEIGKANKGVALAYFADLNHGAALPFALKALEIYMKCDKGGDYSEEIALIRKVIGIIYGELGEKEKALETLQLSVSEFKNLGSEGVVGSQWISSQMQSANILLGMGRNEEAIAIFESVIALAETKGNHGARAVSFMCIARGYCNQDKFADAKKYMKIAQKIFQKKKEIIPFIRATAFEDMSNVYEEMNDYENAVSFIMRAVAMPELPQDNLIKCSTRLFGLISLSGKHKKEILNLEEVVGRLKERLGPEHVQVGFGYINLGLGYMLCDKPEAGAESYVLAKNAFDASLGPHHLDSLRTSQTISVIYASLGRYDPAVDVQAKVVACLKGLRGPREQEFLDVAVSVLKGMKKRGESPTSWKVLRLKMANVTLQRFQSLPNHNCTRDCNIRTSISWMAMAFGGICGSLLGGYAIMICFLLLYSLWEPRPIA